MEILFLGGIFPPIYRREIERNSKGPIQYAADTLQQNFINGLDQLSNVTIITLPFIGSYPFRYKKIITSSFQFNHKNDFNDICVSFFNLSLLKHLSRYIQSKKVLIELLSKSEELRTIIIYSIHSPFIKSAVESKKKFPGTKICLIVPDLPEYMSDNRNIFYKILKKVDASIINNNLKHIDSFVFLTDFMKNAFNIDNKPWVRIEGIFNKSNYIDSVVTKDNDKIIFYSGSIAHRYGIMNLIHAFHDIKSENYQLWICGDGDTRKDIEKLAEINLRIRYLGQLPHEDVIKLQKRATVLVNPRTSEGEFTNYSFPSKTMEYLASGTPTIIHKLNGIPEEYYEYCIIAEEESAEGLRKKIIEICEQDNNKLFEFGKRAQDFIFKYKNPKVQAGKIIDLLNQLDHPKS